MGALKGHGGLEDNVPRKSLSDRSPILDESAINKQPLQRHTSTSMATSDEHLVGTLVLGPEETTADGLPEISQEKYSEGIVRITKRLRLALKWKDKNEQHK